MELQPRAEFNKWVHRFGIGSSGILFLLMCGFPLIAAIAYDIWPSMSQLWPAVVTVILIMAPRWPAETLGYMTTMGSGAMYMSYVTGNVTSLRMPVTVGTINALELEPNTDESHSMALVACGASIITTIGILALGIFIAIPLEPVLTAPVLQPAFNYVIPAIFGGLVAQTILKKVRYALLYLIPLSICLFFCYFTEMNNAYYMLIGLAASAVAFVLDYKHSKNRPAD